MKRIIPILPLVLILLGTFPVYGQPCKLVAKGDLEVKNLKYHSAIDYYKQAIEKCAPLDKGEVYIKMGDCWYFMNQYENAISNYSSFTSHPKFDKQRKLRYGSCLLSTGSKENIGKAREFFLSLNTGAPDPDYDRLIKSCDLILKDRDKGNLKTIKRQSEVNSPQSEFGLAFFQGKVVFASTRQISNQDERTGQGYADLYEAEISDGELLNPVLLNSKLNNKNLNEGTFAFSEKNQTAYFTRSNSKTKLCDIYTAQLKDGNWSDIKLLELNPKGYNFGHPSVTSDGKTLYFASDRPGGAGKKDIWKAALDPEGKVIKIEPVKGINTPEDEMYPFISDDKILFFSSNGHPGMGGQDIFYSEITEDGYNSPVNPGAPINSSADDFSIILNKGQQGGFFCTNRNNEQESDDIYSFPFNPLYQDLNGKVLEANLSGGNLIPLDSVEIQYKTGNKLISKAWSKLGDWTIPNSAHNDCGLDHLLIFSKKGYVTDTIKVPCHSDGEITALLYKEKEKQCSLVGMVTDRNTSGPLYQAKITLTSLTGRKETTYTDRQGRFIFENIAPNDIIILRANKPGYLNDSKLLQIIDCDKSKVLNESSGHDTNFRMIPDDGTGTIKIEDIFYDFDSASLRSESFYPLNKLVNQLNENPAIKVQINSHTDERGSIAYNDNLSKRRGESVVNYLIRQGISRNRLTSTGLGERYPVVRNADNEIDHQKNRRTEFKITGRIQTTIDSRKDSITDEKFFNLMKVMQEKDVRIPNENLMEIYLEFKKGVSPNFNDLNLQMPQATPVNQAEGREKTPVDQSVTPAQPGTFWRIQIAAVSQKVNIKTYFPGTQEIIAQYGIVVDLMNGLYKYRIGRFLTQEDAIQVKTQLINLGYRDCFLVNY